MTVDELMQQLKQMGCKLTPQRRMLVEALLEAGEGQLTADDIYQKVRTTYPDVGLDTIYRNLRLLVKLDVVAEVKLPGHLSRYALNRRAHQHALTCLDCGAEVPLGHCPIKELEVLAQQEHGFVITSHHIELFGYCPRCADARRGSSGDK